MTASPVDATRVRSPLNRASVRSSFPVKSWTAPATYAVPTSRWLWADNLVGSAEPQAAVSSPNQSSSEGALLPGVHSVLK